MCQYQATDGVANDWHIVHYASFARGGAGLVMVEATGVTDDGRISPGCLGLWNDEQTAAMKRVVDVVHQTGGKIGVQLNHAGRKASLYKMFPGLPDGSMPIEEGGWQTVAPSAVAFTGLREPRALEVAEIEAYTQAFIDSADRAVAAGFDAIELHASHGYLLFSFMSPLSNFREDEYGGSLENRARMVRNVVRGIRKNHPELPIIVRISASEWRPDGFTPEDGGEVARMLKEDGADMIDVSSGANIAEASIKIGPSYQTQFTGPVQKGGLPVNTVGMILAAEQAEALLVTGQADTIMIGREALRNPFTPLEWAKKLRSDRLQEFVPGSYHRGW